MKIDNSFLYHRTALSTRHSCLIAGLALSAASFFAVADALGNPVVNPGNSAVTVTNPSSTKEVITVTSSKTSVTGSFDIGASETTQIIEPSSSSILLFRDVSGNPSQILGRLIDNGQLWLVNGSGVFFSKGARVNVAGLIASTADISDTNFNAANGNYVFDMPGNANASIVNEGRITAKRGGLVALVAPSVVNDGIIRAKLGKVTLGAGQTFTIDFYGDELYDFAVNNGTDKNGNPLPVSIVNAGLISAKGGTVYLTADAAKGIVDQAINTTGIIDASSSHMEGGTIILDGGASNVTVGGTLNASGTTGGKVQVLSNGGTINLASANITADGKNGGGTVNIGGGAHGQGTLPHAGAVNMDANSRIDASATDTGNGGTVVLWSDGDTNFNGTILAQGGPKGGNGGSVETSGKILGDDIGVVDASAPKGNAGEWLLDPNNIIIQAAGSDTNVTGNPNFTSTNDNAIVTTGSIDAALNSGTSVTIATTSSGANTQAGDIEVAGSILKSSGSDSSLTLTAIHNITIDGGVSISSTNNKLNVTLDANSNGGPQGGSDVMLAGSSIASNGGNIIFGGGANPLTTNAVGNTASGLVDSQGTSAHAYGVDISGATVNAGGGNISIRGTETSDPNVYAFGGVSINSGAIVQTNGSGTVNINGTGGFAFCCTNAGVYITGTVQTQNGALTINGLGGTGSGANSNQNSGVDLFGVVTSVNGPITVTGTGGNYSVPSTFNYVTNDGIEIAGTVSSTGTGAGAATITLNGFGGNTGPLNGTNPFTGINYPGGPSGVEASYGNAGVRIFGSTISTVDGNVVINGTGGSIATGGAIPNGGNEGVVMNGGASIKSTGKGNLNVTGTAGSGATSKGILTDNNFAGAINSMSSTGTGNIVLHSINSGTEFDTAISVTATGTGTISVTSDNDIAALDGGTFSTNNEAITFDSNASGGGAGAISLTGISMTSNGGNIILGGSGATPSTGPAVGDAAYNNGIALNDTTVNAGGGSVGGNITFNGHGWSNSGASVNSGVEIGSVTGSTVETNNAGTIVVNGIGGNSSTSANNGIDVNNASTVQTQNGALILTGFGGAGVNGNNFGVSLHANSKVTSVNGPIAINGTGGNSAGGANVGVGIDDGAQVLSTGTGTGAATITINGTAGSGNGDNAGVLLSRNSAHYPIPAPNNAVISSVDGNISIIGIGAGTGTNNHGVWSAGGVQIGTSGKGNVTVTGTGAPGSDGVHFDIAFDSNPNVISTTGTGTITVTGNAGGAGDIVGTNINNTQITANGGLITINGVAAGSVTAGQNEYGTLIQNTQITNTNGNVTISGNVATTGDGTYNEFAIGLCLSGASCNYGGPGSVPVVTANSNRIVANNGDIFFSGTANGTQVRARGLMTDTTTIIGNHVDFNGFASSNSPFYNVEMESEAVMINDNTNVQATKITGEGTAVGVNDSENIGFWVDVEDVYNTTFPKLISTGDTIITGTASNTFSTPQPPYSDFAVGTAFGGVILQAGGNMTITGTASKGGSTAIGVEIESGTFTANNTLSITGTAGNAANLSYGILMQELRPTQTTSSFSGNTVDISGTSTSTTSGSSGSGVAILTDQSYYGGGPYALNVTSGAGGTDVTGVGGNGGGGFNTGITMDDNVTFTSSGNMVFNGTGGSTGANNYGTELAGNTNFSTTNGGNITFNSIGGNNATAFIADLRLDSSAVNTVNAAGNVTFNNDTFSLSSGTGASVTAANTITVEPITPGTTMGAGTGAGTLSIIDADIAKFTAPHFVFGSAITGNTDVNSAITYPATLTVLSGQGSITLDHVIKSAISSGRTVTLEANNNFINNVGPSAINTTGNWYIASSDPALDTLNGLTSDINYYHTAPFAGTGPGLPNLVSTSENVHAYKITPTLTITANNESTTYGTAAAPFTDTKTGLVFAADAATITGTESLTAPTYSGAPSNAGNYAILAAQGTLTSPTGYIFAFANGTLTVNKAVLTVAANNTTSTYGTTPLLTDTITGFVLGQNLGTSGVTGSATLNSTGNSTSNVGNYPITINQGSLASNNYSFTGFTPATLTINAATLTLTTTNGTSVYGTTPNVASDYTVTGFVNGQNSSILSGSPTVTTPATATSNVGMYGINAVTNTLSAGSNYTITVANNGILTVTPAPLNVNANNVTSTSVPSTFGYTITGFVNGNTPASSTSGTPNIGTTANNTSPPGIYAITISQGSLAILPPANYFFAAFNSGVLKLGNTTAGIFGTTVIDSFLDHPDPHSKFSYAGQTQILATVLETPYNFIVPQVNLSLLDNSLPAGTSVAQLTPQGLENLAPAAGGNADELAALLSPEAGGTPSAGCANGFLDNGFSLHYDRTHCNKEYR